MNVKRRSLEPIVDTLLMREKLAGVTDKRGKIARMIHAGELLP